MKFSNFQEIASKSRGKQIILFGSGGHAAKTFKKLHNKPIYILDNNSNMWGIVENGIEIKNPSLLEEHAKAKDVFILICTTSFQEVSAQLQSFGYNEGEDFVVTPILNDLRIVDKLEACKTKLWFSSGSPPQESDKYGGGIYELEVNGLEWSYKKVHSGTCHGLYRHDDSVIAVDQIRGLLKFDLDGKITSEAPIPDGSRCHGISHSDITNYYYVAASDMDSIYIVDDQLKIIDTISISDKFKRNQVSVHHCNDIAVFGESIYLSMFSATGNWSNLDIYDGAVLEFDLKTKAVVGPVITGLWMPHNVCVVNGCLTVLDSLPGYLRKNNAQIVGQFPGFTRGLANDGDLFYIGQSRNRNYSKYLGVSNNISLDSSIIIFDEATKVSRSLQLPPQMSEIHSIVLV